MFWLQELQIYEGQRGPDGRISNCERTLKARYASGRTYSPDHKSQREDRPVVEL